MVIFNHNQCTEFCLFFSYFRFLSFCFRRNENLKSNQFDSSNKVIENLITKKNVIHLFKLLYQKKIICFYKNSVEDKFVTLEVLGKRYDNI